MCASFLFSGVALPRRKARRTPAGAYACLAYGPTESPYGRFGTDRGRQATISRPSQLRKKGRQVEAQRCRAMRSRVKLVSKIKERRAQ